MTTSGSAPADRRDHWDRRYVTAGPDAVSWYQERPTVALELIAKAGLDRTTSVVDVGGGAGRLVDALLAAGWGDVTVLDVSDVALAAARERVGPDRRAGWLEQDLLTWEPSRRYDLWHDRAVFHFLEREQDRQRYRYLLRQALAPGGTVIVGTFASDGPTHCSGLPVVRYDVSELTLALGGDALELVGAADEAHVTPAGGVQPFTWVALRAGSGSRW